MVEHYPPYNIWNAPDTIDYTETQKKTLFFIYYVSQPFSLLGSLSLIYVVWKGKLLDKHRPSGRTNRLPRPTSVRLLLGYSVMDVIESSGKLVFGPWSVPKGTPFVYKALGTIQTCEASGFFFNFYTGLWIYSGSLALYYALVIRFGWKEEYVAKRLEPFLHLLAWIYPLVISTFALSFGYFNPISGLPGFCWISDTPSECSLTGQKCYRGQHYVIFATCVASGAITLSFLVILVSFFFVYLKVRATEKKMAEYGLNHRSSASRLELTRQTGRQAMSYMGAFVFTNATVIVLQAGPDAIKGTEKYYFIGSAVFMILFPMQGFFNAYLFLTKHHESFAAEAPGFHAFVVRFVLNNSDRQKRTGRFASSVLGSKNVSSDKITLVTKEFGIATRDSLPTEIIKDSTLNNTERNIFEDSITMNAQELGIAARFSMPIELVQGSTFNNPDCDIGSPYEAPSVDIDSEFQQMFGVTTEIAMRLVQSCIKYDPNTFHETLVPVAAEGDVAPYLKVLAVLKTLRFGTSFAAFASHFNMDESTVRKSFHAFFGAILSDPELLQTYLSPMTRAEAEEVTRRHMARYKIAGIAFSIGLIGCKNGPNFRAHEQGIGRQLRPTLLLEAGVDSDLYFWHTAIGYPKKGGPEGDVIVWEPSPLYDLLESGQWSRTVDPGQDFEIGGERFRQLWFLLDLESGEQSRFLDETCATKYRMDASRFLNTLSSPEGKDELHFAKWHYETRLDAKRGIYVLQSKFRWLRRPVELLEEETSEQIKNALLGCVLMHNMMVRYRQNIGIAEDCRFYEISEAICNKLREEMDLENEPEEVLEDLFGVSAKDAHHLREVGFTDCKRQDSERNRNEVEQVIKKEELCKLVNPADVEKARLKLRDAVIRESMKQS